MSTATDNMTTSSVIAAAASLRAHGPYRAVMMKKDAAGLRLVWKKIDDGTACDFKAFVEQVLPSAASPANNGSTPAGVLGLDCADVAFYRIAVPPVPDQQLGPIVRMQAESLLPLPPDRMQMAWRAEAPHEGKRSCSIAAARSDQLSVFAGDVKGKTSRIILNAEAVVKAWTELFDGDADRAVLIHMRRQDTQVLLADCGVLRHAATVDVGADDLNGADVSGDLELFVHDVRNALELLEGSARASTPVYVLGDDVMLYEPAIAALTRAGISIRFSRPKKDAMHYAHADGVHSESAAAGSSPVGAADICEYLEPIGLALIALDGTAATLNLFEGLLTAAATQKPRRTRTILVRALLAAAVVVIACLVVWKAMDKASLEKLTDLELNHFIEQQKTRQLVASQRPDVLHIIAILTEVAPSGMLLDNFEFKKGSPVSVATFARSREELYEFEKKLDGHKDISQVKILNPTLDDKQNRINFKLEFNYKQFSEKK
ncbi:MAG: hypothetical protein IH624_10320 [Phycisphaerae bacterium]|nr:hypothetical protein [Phycisphaerae bacterium]